MKWRKIVPINNKIIYLASLGGIGSVNAVHIKNRAKLFHKLGYDVGVISEYPKDGVLFKSSEELQYHYMKPYNGSGKLRGLRWWLDQFFGINTYVQVKKMLLDLNPKILILYECNSAFLNYLLQRLCKKNNIKIGIEVSEWMEVQDYKFPTSLVVKQKEIQHSKLNKKASNIITISKYLERHYQKQKCNTVTIPPLFDIPTQDQDIIRYAHNGCVASVRLVFAGSLEKKDYILILLQAILHINSDTIQIAIDVIGPSKEEIRNMLGLDHLEKYGIFLYGRLPNEETVHIVKQADFSVLFRENRRYAKAGVSTKFSESMCVGVPSICTKVGGTDSYVEDGINGFLISENSMDDICSIFNKILNMSDDEILNMKRNALKTAKNIFNLSAYTDDIEYFLKKM